MKRCLGTHTGPSYPQIIAHIINSNMYFLHVFKINSLYNKCLPSNLKGKKIYKWKKYANYPCKQKFPEKKIASMRNKYIIFKPHFCNRFSPFHPVATTEERKKNAIRLVTMDTVGSYSRRRRVRMGWEFSPKLMNELSLVRGVECF